MARNIEVKVRIASVEALLPAARALADGPPEPLAQDDTFFTAPRGRLKLREFADGSAELIQYERPDTAGARASDYVRAPVAHPAALREALGRALGLRGRVRKQRLVLMAGATRIHLDRVEGLGDFLELEVVLGPGVDDRAGHAEAARLMAALGLADAPHLPGSYLDLIRAEGSAGLPAGGTAAG